MLESLITKIQTYNPTLDTELLTKTYHYAVEMHEGQMRKSGDPYVVHPIRVANIIADMQMDTASVCAALLHDVIEDTDVSGDDIRELFGAEIAFLVEGVTKLGKLNFACREDQQAESFRKMLIAMSQDIRVLVVKLGDRLDNMQTLDFMKIDSQERIAEETMEIYAPLAGRLGINWLKADLEDLSFKYLHPEDFKDLSRQVKDSVRNQSKYVDDVVKRLNTMLTQNNPHANVSGRAKHLYSIYRKMKRQEVSFDQIYDFIAFRVLVDNLSDCYASLGIVHSQWTPIPGRFKDYIALPKENLYQSLHTTVMGPGQKRIEIQIRTHEMHATAESGIAAHWSYKQGTKGLTTTDAQRFAWLRKLLEYQQDLDDPAEFFESVKVDLFSEEVYVFTPAGDVKNLPRNATPVDFAYSVHSEVGNKCVGARVNSIMVPLRHKLLNGDVVEIMTSKNQKPNKDWLDFVVTGRARTKIRAYLRAEEREKSIELGKELLERTMRKHDLSFSRFSKSANPLEKLASLKMLTFDELLAQIGYGRVEPITVVDLLKPPNKEVAAEYRPSILERTLERVNSARGKDKILVDGMPNMLVSYAKCCNPLPGDAITGWITRGRGVSIHRRACPRAMELDPMRRIDVIWSSMRNAELPVSMRIVTDNKPGILNNLSATFASNGVNISEANCRTTAGQAENIFQFTISDVARLKELMRLIAKLEGVKEVQRI